jgi:hypothetical protein
MPKEFRRKFDPVPGGRGPAAPQTDQPTGSSPQISSRPPISLGSKVARLAKESVRVPVGWRASVAGQEIKVSATCGQSISIQGPSALSAGGLRPRFNIRAPDSATRNQGRRRELSDSGKSAGRSSDRADFLDCLWPLSASTRRPHDAGPAARCRGRACPRPPRQPAAKP